MDEQNLNDQDNQKRDLEEQKKKAAEDSAANAAKEVAKQMAKKKLKMVTMKVGLAILSAIAPYLIIFLIGVAIIAAAFALVSLVMSMVDVIYTGTDKFYNFIQYGTFADGETTFMNRLKDEHEEYRRMPNAEGELDLALILSTINYGRVFETDKLDSVEQKDNITDSSDFYQVVKGEDIKAFYKVMNNELGNPYTLLPKDKKLLGHLVDIKITGKCVPKPTGLFTLMSLGGEVIDSLMEVSKVFGTMFVNTAFDASSSISVGQWLTLPFKPFKIANEIWAYGSVSGADGFTDTLAEGMAARLAAEMNFYVSGWENHNPAATLARIAKNSEKPNCGENEIAIPQITYFQNYELYEEYLTKYMDISFVHRMYINCKKCQYQESPDSTKRIIAKRMVDEIFAYKKSYNSLVASQTGVGATIYIPGSSSFVFDIGDRGESVLEMSPTGLVTSPYGGNRVVRNAAGVIISQGPHSGVDFGIVQGTPLYALADGEVVRSKMYGGYGNFVKIKHELNGETFYSVYAHMSVLGVAEGDFIGGGQSIGLSGGEPGSYGAGNSNGPHLHFEIQNQYGEHIDPMGHLRGAIQGSGIFEATQTYLAMKDYDLPYCDASNSSQYTGSMPLSLATIGRKLGKETDPSAVIASICKDYSANKYGFLTSEDLKTNFKLVGTKLTNPTIDVINESLTKKKPLLVSIKGGAFNMINDGGNIVILQKNDKYLITSAYNETKNGMYSKEDINTMIIPYIDQGVWSFEGVE